MLEGALEFEAAAADILQVGAEEANDGFDGGGCAWFVDALLIDEDTAGQDERLGAFARGGVSLVDKELVEPNFFNA